MRRPLFGNGFPKRMLFDDGAITVFDTNDFTPQENAPLTIAVTLFCWAWQNYQPDPNPTRLPRPVVTVASNGGAPIALAQRFDADILALQAAQVANVAKPIVLLDRYVVRGDQQIIAANINNTSTVANGMKCFIYGYYEMAGAHVPNLPFKPLQPAPLVAPFSAPPTLVEIAGANASLYKTAHKLNNIYIDLLDINVNAGGLALVEAGADTTAFIRFPDGTKLPIPVAANHLLLQSSPFDKQPFIAANANDVNIDVGFDSSGAGGNVALSAYGNLLRH